MYRRLGNYSEDARRSCHSGETLKGIGTDPVGNTQAQFTDLVKKDIERYIGIARKVNLKIN